MKLSRVYRTTAILALAALSVNFARADEPAAAPADAGVIGSLSLASADKVQAFAKLAGVPLPPFATPEGVEKTFPFVGAGKFDNESPVAIGYLMGKKITDHEQVMFVLPIKSGGGDFSTMHDLKKTDVPDTMTDDSGFPFRNTGSYVLFGGTFPTTSKFDTTALAAKFKPTTTAGGKISTPIVKLDIDLKEIKKVNPDFFDHSMALSASDEKNPASVAMHDFVTQKIERFDLDLNQTGDDYGLSARVAPMHIDMAKFQKAGLPKDCVMRADMCLSAESMKGLIRTDNDSKMTEIDEGAIALMDTIFLGDSESIGLSPVNEGTLFDVIHHPHPGDLKAALQPIVAQLNTEKGPEAVSAELSEYKLADGTAVARIVVGKGGGKFPMYIDTVAHGDMIYTTASLSEERQVEQLMALKSEGTTTSIASGWVNVVETAKLAHAMTQKLTPKDPIPELPSAAIDAIGTDLVNWSADNDGDGMKASISLPPGLIKVIGMAASQ